MSSGAIPTGIFAASSITGNLSATSSGLGAPNAPGPPKDTKVNLHTISFSYFPFLLQSFMTFLDPIRT